MSWPLLLIAFFPTLMIIVFTFFIILSKNEKNEIQVLLNAQRNEQQEQRNRFDEHQVQSLKLIQDSLQNALSEIHSQVNNALSYHTNSLEKQINFFTQHTREKLKDMGAAVDQRLNTSFEKTNNTFTNIMNRLTVIDEAQKKMAELSMNLMNLSDILNDKRSRGAFGEIQLNSLIRNSIPENHFSIQHTLSNGKRADCLLYLPKPTGNIAIDAKFPLESYQKLINPTLSEKERRSIEQTFRQDIKKHIKNIAEKYILPEETATGAIMFIPSESIFAEIHSHYQDLVEYSQTSHVWIVSPTTLMAILTTIQAVLKNEATREQVHTIQTHLISLSKDFSRFQARMDNLLRHIQQAHEDIELIHKSSQKITSRFNKIEKVELEKIEN